MALGQLLIHGIALTMETEEMSISVVTFGKHGNVLIVLKAMKTLLLEEQKNIGLIV